MKLFFTILVFLIFFVAIQNQSFAQTDDELVVLHTNLGKITIEFFPNDAPNHVSNFIELAETGFYEGTLFHRIIPGFMIQGGDPNTIDQDESTWGTGGPEDSVTAEFNSIKHNRGIVSMARAADPNSAGSQFFIVHQDSNFLDEQYTVFGRIVTQESFETLDNIASVETKTKDIPVNIEDVRITKVEVVNRSEASDLLQLDEPERTNSMMTSSTDNQKFESESLDVAFSVPAGWLLQEPEKTDENTPDVVAVGPKVGTINPVISLTITETNGKNLDDLIIEKNEFLQKAVDSGSLNIISQEKLKVDDKDSYITYAEGTFQSDGQPYEVKFREVIIYTSEKFYTFAYSNGVENFDDELPRFENSVNSFKITSEKEESVNLNTDEGGGCLIATAAYGSELAPQVQYLREIRDGKLMNTESGASFMTGFNQVYYSFSPYIADMERENPVFKEMVKIGITPMLSTLSIMSMADSEEEILGYGIGVILMNIGMYVAAPAIVIYTIRK